MGDINSNLLDEKLKEYHRGFFYGIDRETTFKSYIFFVSGVLKDFYSSYRNEDGKYINIPGDPNEYSRLNFIAAHFQSLSVIATYINQRILDGAKEGKLIASRQLNFEDDKSNWEDEMKNLIHIFGNLKYDILSVEGGKQIFHDLVKLIEETTEKGEISEKKMLQFIKSNKPMARDFEVGGEGKEEDIIDGIDIKFKERGDYRTVQHKRCINVNRGKGSYYVNGVGGIRQYDVDYMGFHTRSNELYLFLNNEKVKIEEYKNYKGEIEKKYRFPIKNYLYQKQLKNKL